MVEMGLGYGDLRDGVSIGGRSRLFEGGRRGWKVSGIEGGVARAEEGLNWKGFASIERDGRVNRAGRRCIVGLAQH